MNRERQDTNKNQSKNNPNDPAADVKPTDDHITVVDIGEYRLHYSIICDVIGAIFSFCCCCSSAEEE